VIARWWQTAYAIWRQPGKPVLLAPHFWPAQVWRDCACPVRPRIDLGFVRGVCGIVHTIAEMYRCPTCRDRGQS